MKTQLLLSVLIASSLFVSRVSADESANGETNRVVNATNTVTTAKTNNPSSDLGVESPIVMPAASSEWDKTDFGTRINCLGFEATDTFTYYRWKIGPVSFGPIIESTYACKESGIAHEGYFVGISFRIKPSRFFGVL